MNKCHRIYYSCIICKDIFSTNNLLKHHERCKIKGGKINFEKMPEPPTLNCQYCDHLCKNINSLRNHERLCKSNPNKQKSNLNTEIGRTAWNKGKRDKPDTRDPKLIGKHGGYRENSGRVKKFRVADSFGKPTTLQGNYELRCSDILNELGIKWNRPGALKYDNRNYFADFYLPDYDVYLDPKNDYKAKLDEEKIEKVRVQNDVKVYIILNHQLTSEYILEIINPFS